MREKHREQTDRRPLMPPAAEVAKRIIAVADDRAGRLGHVMSKWVPAKASKYGAGAAAAVCLCCGRQALVMPIGDTRTQVKVARENPGLRGPAVTEACPSSTEAGLLAGII